MIQEKKGGGFPRPPNAAKAGPKPGKMQRGQNRVVMTPGICHNGSTGGDSMSNPERGVSMPTEMEMRKIELATLYELRLTISESDKQNYTKEEILQLLDQIAVVKK